MDTSDYLDLFLDESRESLQALNASLLDLERDPADAAPIAVIFRIAHSLKGMSATMGFTAMARLTHRMEEVLAAMRDGQAPMTPAVGDALFACLDTLQEMVDRVAAGDGREVDASAVIARLGEVAEATAQTAATLAPAAQDLVVVRIDVTFDEDCMLAAARALMVAREIAPFGDLIRSEPTAERIDAGDVAGGAAFWVACPPGTDPAAIRARALSVSEVASCHVAPIADPVGPATSRSAEPVRAPRAASTVRVGTDRLDALMNLMGEMLVQRSRLAQVSRDHDLGDLRAVVDEVARVTDDLQSLVMEIRMVPVDAVFMRFPRMVRDLANSLGKQAELVVSGEDTALDRAVIDGLGDPLVHMLRNAVDHGLEPPGERVGAGKDPVGVVRLCARQDGGSVVIEVSDDGRGMDPAALRASAVAKGLLDRAAAEGLDDDEALELVFLPGFSTVTTTTDVSGRGVGMDAARSAIAAMRGDVAIASVRGEGSRVTIRLPLTLAVLPALLVTAGPSDQVWALPLEAVDETLTVVVADLPTIGGRACLDLRGAVLPLVRLSDHLALAGPRGIAGPDDRVTIVVVRAGTSPIGLVVDGLVGTRDVLITPLPGHLGDVAGVAGATILGDGSVALILDVAALAAGAA